MGESYCNSLFTLSITRISKDKGIRGEGSEKKKALVNAIILSLFQITFESFPSGTECFHQKGMVAASQRWKLVVILGKLPDRAILMVMWQSVELCPGCWTPSLGFLSIFGVFQDSCIQDIFFPVTTLSSDSENSSLGFLVSFYSYPSLLLAGVGGWVSKTTSRFDDLLERPTELRKAVILMVAVYYGERIHFEIREGNRHVGQSPGETRYQLPGALSQWSHMGMLHLPSTSVGQHVQSVVN